MGAKRGLRRRAGVEAGATVAVGAERRRCLGGDPLGVLDGEGARLDGLRVRLGDDDRPTRGLARLGEHLEPGAVQLRLPAAVEPEVKRNSRRPPQRDTAGSRIRTIGPAQEEVLLPAQLRLDTTLRWVRVRSSTSCSEPVP